MSKESKLREHVEKILAEGGALVNHEGKSIIVMAVKDDAVQTVDVIPFEDPETLGNAVLDAVGSR